MARAWYRRGPLHWIAHLTGVNGGLVQVWYDGPRMMVGFRCSCGKLSHIQESPGRPAAPAHEKEG